MFDDDCRDTDPPTAPDPLESFGAFVTHVRSRLEAGRAYEATRPATLRPTAELISEIQDELADVCGWSACLWAKLEALRECVRNHEGCTSDEPRRLVGAERGRR